MNTSFEEKSVWIQLVAMLAFMGGYLVMAGNMFAQGVRAMPAYAALFTVATIAMVAFMIASYTIAAIAARPESRDERGRLIAWKSEHHSSWVVAVGVFGAITAMVLGIDTLWIAHGLLLSLVLSEVLGYVLRLVYYRRGI